MLVSETPDQVEVALLGLLSSLLAQASQGSVPRLSLLPPRIHNLSAYYPLAAR